MREKLPPAQRALLLRMARTPVRPGQALEWHPPAMMTESGRYKWGDTHENANAGTVRALAKRALIRGARWKRDSGKSYWERVRLPHPMVLTDAGRELAGLLHDTEPAAPATDSPKE